MEAFVLGPRPSALDLRPSTRNPAPYPNPEPYFKKCKDSLLAAAQNWEQRAEEVSTAKTQGRSFCLGFRVCDVMSFPWGRGFVGPSFFLFCFLGFFLERCPSTETA